MGSTETWRLFIALPIEVSPPLLAQLKTLAKLGRSVRPIRAEQAHLTLKFLGEVDIDRISFIKTALNDIGARTSSFAWSIQGLGAFPHGTRPRVVWAGVKPQEPIIALANEIDQRLGPLGFPRESRPYHPHVTLARVQGRPPEELLQILHSQGAKDYSRQQATSLVLYRSLLKSSGAAHQKIHEVSMSGHD